MKKIIMFILHRLGDVIGCFELIWQNIMQRTIKESLACMFGWIVWPFQIAFLLLKNIAKLSVIGIHFKNPLGKIFYGFGTISTITLLVLSVGFPDLLDQICAFEPISIEHLTEFGETFIKNYFDLYETTNIMLKIILAITTLIPVFVTLICLCGACYIPIVAYIWVVLFIGFIFAGIQEFFQPDSAWTDFIEHLYHWDIKVSLAVTFESVISFYLYTIPVINVIVYRIRMNKDKAAKLYPPKKGRTAEETRQYRDMMHNRIYSYVVK